jgi:CTP:molybdopterin cytidylyltransferase MocA
VIPAIVLAAGSGRRMGGPKALLEVDGMTLLDRAVQVAAQAGCTPVLAVIGPWDPGPVAARLIPNPDTSTAINSARALPPGSARALLMAVDQVAVDAGLLKRLLACSDLAPESPVACAYAGTLGIPAIVPARLFPQLLALRGDRGAKELLHAEAAVSVPFPEGILDLDRPEDLARFRR